MRNPLVSIVIPVYNGSNYLAEAINSALFQTYKNIEIIVVNDGSNDENATEKIALSYGKRIRYLTKTNGGVSSALNYGIEEMKGDYFSWLSHDDLYDSTKIEKQVDAIISKNDIILCSGYLIDENNTKINYRIKTLDKNINGRELFRQFLKGYNLNGLGFLIPKKVFETAGNFDESMRYLQDLDLWLRIMHFDYNFICKKELLVMTRIHKDQTTNTESNLFNVDRHKLAKKHIEILNTKKNKHKKELLELYLYLFIKGNNKNGIKIAKKQLKKDNNYNLFTFIKSVQLFIIGKFRYILKKIYNNILIFKKQRS